VNRIGIYYAYWTESWDADFHPYIDKVAELGFDVLEVNGGTVARMSPAERRALRGHAAERGIGLTYCIGLPAAYDIAAEERATREKGIAYLQAMAAAIGELGGGSLGGIIYGSWPTAFAGGAREKAGYVERSVASMREAIKAAEDNGVLFNVEVVNRFEQFILNTCDEALEYVAAVDSPNLKILLDTFHLNIEEDFVGEAIQKAGDKLGHFHIGENNRKPPGFGHIPWTEVAAALRKIDYKGDVVMEPFVRPSGQVGSDIKVFRDVGEGMDLDEEARKALLFMRGVLK
jgi:D-psicose/D-tagatose/L-ribulose 3-epimerase